jgi:[ribosomal protein S5]-alanine N-acetyltransferase
MNFSQRLETERFCLRRLSSADKPYVFELMGDEDVRRFLGGPIPIARRDAAASGYFTPGEGEAVWLVETKGAPRSVGLVFISKHRDGEGFELSFQFSPEVWGLGFAFEATRRVLDHAVNELRLGRLIAETQSANKASRRLLERLGMTEQRRVRRFGAEQIVYASPALSS